MEMENLILSIMIIASLALLAFSGCKKVPDPASGSDDFIVGSANNSKDISAVPYVQQF